MATLRWEIWENAGIMKREDINDKFMKQYHDNMISGREHGGIMVVKTLCSTLEGVFCNHSIKKK